MEPEEEPPTLATGACAGVVAELEVGTLFVLAGADSLDAPAAGTGAVGGVV